LSIAGFVNECLLNVTLFRNESPSTSSGQAFLASRINGNTKALKWLADFVGYEMAFRYQLTANSNQLIGKVKVGQSLELRI
jgi:hypothetical protein